MESESSSINWSSLYGLSENQAETYMIQNWGHIPTEWNDPLFRDDVLGLAGGAELSAHMNDGLQKYEGENRHGPSAKGIWYRRNFQDQGHPAVSGWTERERKN
jgi:hypothetical protein